MAPVAPRPLTGNFFAGLIKKYLIDPVPVPMFKRPVFMCRKTGTITDVSKGQERVLFVNKSQSGNIINYEGKQHKVITIALNALGIELPEGHRITYKTTKSGFVIPKTIKIDSPPPNLIDGDARIFEYRCDIKAKTANARFREQISAEAIYQVLKISNFSCFYCGCQLKPDNWHLDHCIPESRRGTNTIDNIAPSCPDCNISKGRLTVKEFIHKCKRIADRHK